MLFSSFNLFGKKVGPFDKYKKIIFSQAGEEGILEFLIKKIKNNKLNKLNVVEFGAWDGIHLSNTFYFVKKYNANAIYIEKDKKKFLDLLLTVSNYPKINPINCGISSNIKSKNALDNIIKKHFNKKNDVDILSIDIDSYDLNIWKSLKKFIPKIVVIEINSEMGKYDKIIHSKKNKLPGSSFAATVEVGIKKGYVLVSHIGNCIFIRKDLLKKFNFHKKFVDNPKLLYNDFWLNISPILYYSEYIINFFIKKLYKFKKIYD
jgi:hypothetical protein